MRNRQEKTQGGKPARKKRLKIHEVTAENDIRYQGPLNYQHFQMLGWLCIVATAAVLLITIGAKMDASVETSLGGVKDVLNWVGTLSLPFLLIANFARILNNSEGYRKQLIKNGAAMAGITLGAILLLYRYVVGTMVELGLTQEQAIDLFLNAAQITSKARVGFISFNIFVDLFLCTLVMFFLNYRPKYIFKAPAARIVFRLFTIFPIAYELISLILKIRCARGEITLPLWSFPLLTVKPPMTFVLFIALAVYVKTREWRFRRHGKTHEEFQAFLKTRRNSRNFSVFLAIMLVIVSVVDLVIFLGMSVFETAKNIVQDQQAAAVEQAAETAGTEQAQLSDEELIATLAENGMSEEEISTVPAAKNTAGEADVQTPAGSDGKELTAEEIEQAKIEAYTEKSVRTMDAVGFGGSVYLLFLAPLVLLFSYTRIPKNKQFSMLIPMIAIGLILVLYLEGFYRGVGILAQQQGFSLGEILSGM